MSGPRQALVVATASYTDPEFTKLRAPAQDAADVVDVLADPNIGGFAVTSLVDQPDHAIRRAIDDFLADRDRDDVVVIYVSAHGLLDARGRLYFAATNTVKSRPSSTAVESAWLLDLLEDCAARRQVLILDCCFSGSVGNAKSGNDIDLDRRLMGSGRGRAILTASRALEYSYEGKPLRDGTPSRSVFTEALLRGLRTGDADLDRDGLISVDEAYRYAENEVAARGGKQNPQLWLHRSEGKIMLARNPYGAPVGSRTFRAYPEDPHGGRGRGTPCHDVAFSPDGLMLASAGRDSLVRLWDCRTGEAVGEPLAGHDGPVQTVAFSPDGRLLASGGWDKTVRLWDLRTGVCESQGRHNDLVDVLAFSADGRLLASGGRDALVRLWDGETGLAVGEPLAGHPAAVVAFSPDPGPLATAGAVSAVAFSPDGRLLASGGWDNVVRLWDLRTGNSAVLTGHTDWLRGLAFSADGRLLASAGREGTVRLWDPATVAAIGDPLRHDGDYWTASVAFRPDGTLASANHEGAVRFWDPGTGVLVGEVPSDAELAAAVQVAAAFSFDCGLLAAAQYDGTIWLRDLRGGAGRRPL